ncbi:MAG: nucleotidyltransferase domain-containing protein [Patescibacteria group bacterium]
MKNKKEIKRITDQIVKKYKPEKIILFGSFAYGKPKPSSDIDLLIIKNSGKIKVERIKEVLMKVESEIPLEPLVYTPKEIQERLDLGDFFFQNVFRKGKLLYEKKSFQKTG